MTALDSRNFWPLSSQVISGWSGLSATGAAVLPFAGQLNAANFCSHSSPGFCAQATGSLTEAPLAVVCGACEAAGVGGRDGLAGLGLGVACGAANGGRARVLARRAWRSSCWWPSSTAWPTATPCPTGSVDALGEGGGLPGCGWPATIRNRSWAVRLTASTRLEAFLPGISTMMLRSPWVETSASETPLPLTRASTMSRGLLELGRA